MILYEVKERVAYITLNRPEVLNAINAELCECWNETWKRFRDDDQAWAAILTGGSPGVNLWLGKCGLISHGGPFDGFWRGRLQHTKESFPLPRK